MANPSLKNGYMSVANELVDIFTKTPIPGTEMRIIWTVWRKTWCWKEGDRHKDWDWISISQFEKETGIKHSSIVKSLKCLVVKRLLLKGKNGYKFNQNYDEWVVVKRLPPVVKRLLGGSQTTTKTGSQTTTNKRKKETNTKEIRALRVESPKFNPLGAEVIKAFEEVDPKNKTYYGNATQRSACDYLIDEYGLEEILKRIKFLPQTNKQPFFPKINSPNDLKEKWVKLEDTIQSKTKEKVNGVNYIL